MTLGVCVRWHHENQPQNKHVESTSVTCLDEGSTPSSSTRKSHINVAFCIYAGGSLKYEKKIAMAVFRSSALRLARWRQLAFLSSSTGKSHMIMWLFVFGLDETMHQSYQECYHFSPMLPTQSSPYQALHQQFWYNHWKVG